MNDIKTIEQLISRFLDAETTLDEERRLYQYFQREDIPTHLMPYRDMFRDLALLPIERKEEKPRQQFRWMAWAATLLLLVGFGTAMYLYQGQQLQRQYAGSYMIINGQRIDNLRQLYPEIQKTLAMAQQIESQSLSANDIDNAKASILNNITDDSERQRIEQLLNEI